MLSSLWYGVRDEENICLRKPVPLSIGLYVLWLAGAACSPAETHLPISVQSGASSSSTQAIVPMSSPTPTSPIRLIDFKNFTYPDAESGGTFTFKDGRESTDDDPKGFVDVVYGDVTRDGKEEGLIVHSQSTGGSAIPFFVYIYTMNRDKPKLLQSFDAGERGDGGLRQVYAANGDLVLELYGRDRVMDGGTSVSEDNTGVCCPKFYTRSRYEWRGGRFRLKVKEEALPNLQGNAAYLPLLERKDQ